MTHKPMYSYVPTMYIHTYMHAGGQAGMHACTHTYKCININQYIYMPSDPTDRYGGALYMYVYIYTGVYIYVHV